MIVHQGSSIQFYTKICKPYKNTVHLKFMISTKLLKGYILKCIQMK